MDLSDERLRARCWLEVDLSALRANHREALSLLKPGTHLIAVLKADAYGYGAPLVGKTLYNEGTRFFAVAAISEALELRRALPEDARILCMGPAAPSELGDAISHGIRLTAGSADELKQIESTVRKTGMTAYVHIKLDTGLHRLGFTAVSGLSSFAHTEGIVFEGLYSHLALRSREQSEAQHTLFEVMRDELTRAGFRFELTHLLDSIGLVRFPQWQYDAVRVGAFLYGNVPPEYSRFDCHREVGRFCARVTRVSMTKAGEGVGYSDEPLQRDTLVATVSAGYVDGYPRVMSGVGEVLIRNRRARVLGLICMDQMMVDVTDIDGVRPGDVAVLLGDSLTLIEYSRTGRLNRNEATAIIGRRVPRVPV